MDNDTNEQIPPEIASYIEINYIGQQRGRNKKRMQPKFPIDFWNTYERVLADEPRTTNAVEGFHNAMNKNVTATHPSIWKLISALKKEDNLAFFKLTQHRAGAMEPQKVVYRKLNQRIKNLVTNYSKENRYNYLRSIAHNLKI